MLASFRNELENIETEFRGYVKIFEKTLINRNIDDHFLLIDLKEFDNKLIRFLALYHPQGEFLRQIISYLKISSFLVKIKKDIKYFITKCDITHPKIDALYNNAIKTLSILNSAIQNDIIEEAYSEIISYEKIADELYNELVIEVKRFDNIDEILKMISYAKKLEKISDNVKTITIYLLFAKEGVEI